ncbi:hypothetical protein P4O66_016446 [Electrophorus voltai]|uniref:Uncharacterized protein n=1 Tax=Electrophorus voltai TaxID=2609070 RepID=A0AAD9DN88_9TELE|nr:hypothetical protein P4O66_016446 [Electrophorus voltai]
MVSRLAEDALCAVFSWLESLAFTACESTNSKKEQRHGNDRPTLMGGLGIWTLPILFGASFWQLCDGHGGVEMANRADGVPEGLQQLGSEGMSLHCIPHFCNLNPTAQTDNQPNTGEGWGVMDVSGSYPVVNWNK